MILSSNAPLLYAMNFFRTALPTDPATSLLPLKRLPNDYLPMNANGMTLVA
jgi:hypothetical protein